MATRLQRARIPGSNPGVLIFECFTPVAQILERNTDKVEDVSVGTHPALQIA